MNKICVIFLVLAVLLSTASAESPVKKIRVGVSTVLSGDSAPTGLNVRDAIQFANEKYGKGRFELIIEDDKCSPKDAVSVAHKLINIDRVDYVLGMTCSGATLAAAPLYERAKIPVIATCASAPAIADAGEYIFRTTPNDRIAAKVLAKYVSQKHKVSGVLTEETEYCQGLRQAFVETPSAKTISVISVNYPLGSVDYRTELLRLRKANVEGLFLNSQSENGFFLVLKQIREMKWEVPVYGAYWPASPAFLNVAGELSEGIEFVNTPFLSQILNTEGKVIFDEYVKKYGEIRSIESIFASSYEGFRAIEKAVNAQVFSQEAPDFFYKTKFDGIFGPWGFDEKGEVEGLTFAMYRVEHGKAVPLGSGK